MSFILQWLIKPLQTTPQRFIIIRFLSTSLLILVEGIIEQCYTLSLSMNFINSTSWDMDVLTTPENVIQPRTEDHTKRDISTTIDR